MTAFHLANLLLEDNERSNDYPYLYCRTEKPFVLDQETQSFLLFPYEKYDFATYFNLFSNAKWHRYTVIDKVGLHIELKGEAEIVYVCYESTLARPRRSVVARKKVDNEDFQSIDFTFEDESREFYSIEIVTYGLCYLKNSYFYANVPDESIRDVELAVATTTFKQEAFVTANIDLFRREIIESDDPIASHFTMHVIDNGRTLEADQLSSNHIIVHPNKNVGGAGGFTRGMIEAMEQDVPATHVLLMDDDVQISPESLKRTFSILSLVNDEYKDAFVSGMMLSFENQDVMYEDIGWVRDDGLYGPEKSGGTASNLSDIVRNEAVVIHKPNRYAGWWYCCIPVENIKDKGLPLPIFIRGDDAEYGNRASRNFITMNGVCIWHLTLALKYRAHLERYQVARNSLIAQATTGVYQNVDFLKQWSHNIQLDMKTFNYDSVSLSLDAMEDYLKGPSFIMEDRGQELLMDKMKRNEKLVPLNEFDDSDIHSLVIDPNRLYESGRRSFFQRAIDYLSYNGHRLPSFMLKKDLAVIPWDGWFYPPEKVRMHQRLLVVSKDGEEGIIRVMDKKRFRQLHRRHKQLLGDYKNRHEEVEKAYADARDEMTSVPFWKKYLEI